MSKKKRVAIAGVVVAVTLAALGVFGFWLFSDHHEEQPALSQAAPSTSALAAGPQLIPFTEQDAARLEQALNSDNKAVQAQVLVPELRSGDWPASSVVPDNSLLKIERGSFSPEAGTVKADISGLVRATFVLYLVHTDGQWLIATTERTE